MSKLWICLLVILLAFIPVRSDLAQEPTGPVYLVQAGDSLWDIAQRFRVSMDDLTTINGITNPNQLALGTPLIIPGLDGITGTLTTRPVSLGDSLLSLSRRYQIPVEMLVRLNHLASPSELYVGTNLVLFEENASSPDTTRNIVAPGQSLLELAALNGANPWSYVLVNQLPGSWSPIPGTVLHLEKEGPPPEDSPPAPSELPEAISAIALEPSPLVQGKAAVFKVTGASGMKLGGTLLDHTIHFFEDKDGGYVGLQGVHALTPPGLYTLTMTGTLPIESPYFGAAFTFSQAVLVRSGNYPFDPVLTVSPETIDPAVTGPEDAEWAALAAPVTPEKLWDGQFTSPAPEPFSQCWPSRFGNRRSYNGSAYVYFHSGLDFCGGVGVEIHAPAAGIVVFASPLTVRGNATIINHGWGVYTAYLHQSEFLIHVGDTVTQGQVIGLVGGTGRVTGPHLHWEVWAGDVQVDPLDWLNQIFP